MLSVGRESKKEIPFNMDDRVLDDKITAIFETVANLRKEYERKATRK